MIIRIHINSHTFIWVCTLSPNAHVLAPKDVGVAFAPFAKGMTTFFGRSGTVCYAAGF